MGMTNENANVEQSYFYDDFGNSLGSWGSVSNHYLYTGQEYDDEISGAKLYNLRARYYDSGVGRFVSEDPVLQIGISYKISGCFSNTYVVPQGTNPYPYVENNPINWIDVSGLSRYKRCEGLPWYRRWLCRRIVNWECKKTHEACCYFDLINCLDDIDFECDPDAEEKEAVCGLKFYICLGRK